MICITITQVNYFCLRYFSTWSVRQCCSLYQCTSLPSQVSIWETFLKLNAIMNTVIKTTLTSLSWFPLLGKGIIAKKCSSRFEGPKSTVKVYSCLNSKVVAWIAFKFLTSVLLSFVRSYFSSISAFSVLLLSIPNMLMPPVLLMQKHVS